MYQLISISDRIVLVPYSLGPNCWSVITTELSFIQIRQIKQTKQIIKETKIQQNVLFGLVSRQKLHLNEI